MTRAPTATRAAQPDGVTLGRCVAVLPFHELGAPGSERLGIPFPHAGTPLPPEEVARQVRTRFAAALGSDRAG